MGRDVDFPYPVVCMNSMKRNVLLLASCQAMFMIGGSLLITTSALVGYRLAPDKALATLPLAMQMLASMLTSIPASLLMKLNSPVYVPGAGGVNVTSKLTLDAGRSTARRPKTRLTARVSTWSFCFVAVPEETLAEGIERLNRVVAR